MMKFRVIKWLREKLRRRRRRSHHGEDETEDDFEDDVTNLPRLPSIRPRVLTPSPSTEALTSAGSPFFEKLPGELRRDILLIAFGGGTVHMDLSFVHPLAPRNTACTEDARRSHAGIDADDVYHHPPTVNWDTTVPKSWQWWSSVCHRVVPDTVAPHHILSDYNKRSSGLWGPADDFCRYGAEHYCKTWPGVYPSKCKIGIMGWLLSCRQAYVEGIEVLYRTNIIHMSGQALILNLPRLLPPQRLSDITSLEIVCPFKLRAAEVGAVPEVGCLRNYLAVLSSNLPNLTRLHLALKAKGVAAGPVDMQSVFDALDAFAAAVGPEEFTVLPSRSVYTPLYEAIRKDIIAKDPQQHRSMETFWRNIDGSYILPVFGSDKAASHRKFEASWPKPPRGAYPTAGADTVLDGYWLMEGDPDDEMPIREQCCFGW